MQPVVMERAMLWWQSLENKWREPMSAIWGIVHLDHRDADYNLGIKMEAAMDQYKLDRCITQKKRNAVFGCGLQYITEEAVNEQLPYYDEDNKLFYTADCMLDNRQELLSKLALSDESIPDGALLYQAYLTWGSCFTDHVLGVFSFVIYDDIKNTCVLFTDHTGSRSLYYCLIDNSIYFATVFAPLLAVLPQEDRILNEKWMIACELFETPVMEYFPELTPFEKICQVIAGHYAEAKMDGSGVVINKKCYWSLRRIKELKLKTQEEYRELFIKTLYDCVQSVLRSAGETGITLSSGLDSSSVACVAAQLLGEKGKKLYSFTSVPMSDYKGNQNPYFITDESEGVKSICNAYSNIDPEFIRCEGKNACTELKRLIRYLEFPHKSRQNMVWIDEIYERAARKGCKVVLKGQYGNATISNGSILGRVYDEISNFNFVTAYRELKLFCKINKVSRRKVMKTFLKELNSKIRYSKNIFNDTLVRRELLAKHNILKSVNSNCKAAGSDMMPSKRQRLRFMNDMSALIQLGALDSRLGLYQGIIIRDPLKDKRIIELCASYPMKCFVQEGFERAAVRKYMKNIVPDSILNLTKRRGLQSADYIERLKADWDRTKRAMLESLEQPKLLDYINDNKLEHIRGEIQSDEIVHMEDELMKALMLCSCSIFLDYYGNETLHFC